MSSRYANHGVPVPTIGNSATGFLKKGTKSCLGVLGWRTVPVDRWGGRRTGVGGAGPRRLRRDRAVGAVVDRLVQGSANCGRQWHEDGLVTFAVDAQNAV